ncbi:MAG: response regulator [Chloroflexi bacterium]|nr:response regulator [Chloroflexota bacterium]
MAKRRRALTTGQVADYCSVRPATVFNWVKAGKLKAYTTAGGHYRIRVEDFREFLKRQNIPIDEDFLSIRQGRILIVDDDTQTVGVIQKALEKDDPEYRFATASDGYAAGVQMASFQPDLVVLDLVMPKMDGFELTRRIKNDPRSRGTKVLAVTAYSSEANMKKAREAGADEILTKPLDLGDLRQMTRALLRAGR